jgi:CheY-like chemotaxis protein
MSLLALPQRPGEMTSELLPGDILLVEDDIIIAMEAEYLLLSMGAARCHLASSVAAAIDIIGKEAPRFALLDVNLGGEHSGPVAAALNELGIPFVIASGYGGNELKLPAFSAAPLVTKPYSKGELASAIAKAQLASRQP